MFESGQVGGQRWGNKAIDIEAAQRVWCISVVGFIFEADYPVRVAE